MSRKLSPIDYYITAVIVLTIALGLLAWSVREPYPGLLSLFSLCAVAFLLQQSPTRLRVSATGSTSFVVHLAGGLLFGAFWGGIVAGLSTAAALTTGGKSFSKIAFNAAQRASSVFVAVLVYQLVFGGGLRPAYLSNEVVSAAAVQRDFVLFFVVAAAYILANVSAVSGAASFSSGRPFREVWHYNVRGLFGYDMGSSLLALLVAWGYVRLEQFSIGPIGLVLFAVPVVLLRHVYSMYHELQSSGQELLQVMVKAIEARDPYTSGHSLRVRELSRAIALELQLSAREIEEVETAALLHDVGKIHEEFAPLLRKEGRLTDVETALMQTHAIKSAELVGIISKFRGVIQRAVRHHHERWDGEGYPDGLKGSDIPLAARIILISDTIDAMTTDRPYRKKLPLEVVIGELQKCKGTQFDPELVEVVVSSVAVRRLISGGVATGEDLVQSPRRSQRLSRGSGAFWRLRRA